VKNTLSTVQSIAWQALRNSTDPAVVRESIESRLKALSRSRELLANENWKGGGLLELVGGVLEPFRSPEDRPGRFVITGDNVHLPPKATLALGIALHELGANALKFGALATGRGSILLAWRIEATPQGERLFLRWQEQDGPVVTPPSRKGFGSQVIERGLAHELEGTVHLAYPPEGLVCTVDIPAPRAAS
jgi:two-component sensor histidine kinase